MIRSTLLRTALLLSVFAVSGLAVSGVASAGIAPKPVQRAKKASTKKKKKKSKRRKYPTRRPNNKKLAEPTLGPVPFPEGERLSYKLKMFGAEAGETILAVGKRTMLDGRPVVPLVGFLRSTPFLANFYPINDKVEVIVDEKTFRPISSTFNIRENGKVIDYDTTYDQKNPTITSVRTKKGRKLKRQFNPVGPIHDAISSVYAARRIDMKPGMKFSYYVWDGLRERLVDIHVVKKEKIWTPLGWSEAMRVDVSSVITGGFIKKKALDRPRKKGTAWFGLDPHRTPLKIVTPTKLGQAEAVLVKRWIENE